MFTANPTLAGGPFPHTRWHAQIPACGRRFWKNILPNPKTKNSKTYLRKTKSKSLCIARIFLHLGTSIWIWWTLANVGLGGNMFKTCSLRALRLTVPAANWTLHLNRAGSQLKFRGGRGFDPSWRQGEVNKQFKLFVQKGVATCSNTC